jgi:lipopolysaccharide export system protein LptA
LNIKFSIIVTTSLIIALNISATSLNKDIQIKSDTVEFLKETNQISFINNVEINSNFVSISAKSALYDHISEIISIKGIPSLIKSNRDDSFFNGTAEKIIFYSDEKVHLIGNASMKYENVSISSNIIIFNPRTGKFSSE